MAGDTISSDLLGTLHAFVIHFLFLKSSFLRRIDYGVAGQRGCDFASLFCSLLHCLVVVYPRFDKNRLGRVTGHSGNLWLC